MKSITDFYAGMHNIKSKVYSSGEQFVKIYKFSKEELEKIKQIKQNEQKDN